MKYKLVRTTKGKKRYKKAPTVDGVLAEKTINNLKQLTNQIQDIIYKNVPTSEGIVTLIHSNSLVEKKTLQQTIIIPLCNYIHQIHQVATPVDFNDFRGIVDKLVGGHTLIYFQKTHQLLSIDTYSAPTRAITESATESTVIGPQNVFTESIVTNLSLVRRLIRNPMLKNEDRTIGSKSNVKISILYMEDLVNKEKLVTLKKRIDQLDFPVFTDISILMQAIEDNPLSPFPQYYMTVRPDTISQYLLDGRIVIFMDNSQAALVCPTSFFEMFVSVEDYYNRWTMASLLRILRFFGFFLTIIITPTYISALTFHPEIVPYELLLNIQESRSKVPFSPVIEVLFLELIIEILREAGSRLPTKVGQTIGIVGGIVIGTAAVEAGLVSNILIVLVAVSALLSFLPPLFLMSNTSRFVRYIFILAAGFFGLYGQMLALAWLFAHLLNIRSLGTPYMTPVIPRKATDLMDSVIRFPITYIKNRKGITKKREK